MVFFILRDHAACEDVIQDAFIRVIEKSPKTLDETKVTAWIKTVTRNATYNYLRKNKKMRDELAAVRVSVYETAAGCDTNQPVTPKWNGSSRSKLSSGTLTSSSRSIAT
jgi:DNA-directed RNA polymerase specialized sigma24 family protein